MFRNDGLGRPSQERRPSLFGEEDIEPMKAERGKSKDHSKILHRSLFAKISDKLHFGKKKVKEKKNVAVSKIDRKLETVKRKKKRSSANDFSPSPSTSRRDTGSESRSSNLNTEKTSVESLVTQDGRGTKPPATRVKRQAPLPPKSGGSRASQEPRPVPPPRFHRKKTSQQSSGPPVSTKRKAPPPPPSPFAISSCEDEGEERDEDDECEPPPAFSRDPKLMDKRITISGRDATIDDRLTKELLKRRSAFKSDTSGSSSSKTSWNS